MEFFTPQEIANDLKIHVLTLYKYIRSGKLSALKFGRYYRISKDDLTKFLESVRVSKKEKV